MREHWDVLVASSRMEDRTALLRILDGLSLNVISCSALGEANEVLSREDIPLVFCDEWLRDGCFSDLLPPVPPGLRKRPRVVVTIHEGEWEEYMHVLRQGAFDAVRFPLQPTDVELVVLRALRETRDGAPYRAAQHN